MAPAKIVLIGAGSRSFGPATVRDVLLSEPLRQRGVKLVLMDLNAKHLEESTAYARMANEKVGGGAVIESTTELAKAVEAADAVVSAIEIDRYWYWSQDFHVPRKYGFKQIYGENGGPGGIFHALRNMGPTIEIARAMERLAPKAVLINYTNPETKLCEAVTRLTKVPAVGLCHGVWMGAAQIAHILGKEEDDLAYTACGMNHFTWFQSVTDKKTGEDLYPALRKAEAEGDWLADWHEIGLSRVLFRRFGLWPSPGTNHIGEYLGWAEEFYATQAQYFYDPADGSPWSKERPVPVPEFIYSLRYTTTDRPWRKGKEADGKGSPDDRSTDKPLEFSGELAAPIMESLFCGVKHELEAVNIPNRGAIPNLPDDMVVEVPATSDASGWKATNVAPLPEPIAAIIRTHASIHKLLVEAFAEHSKAKLLQAVLLDPTVTSYRGAVQMVDEMLLLQKDRLPDFA